MGEGFLKLKAIIEIDDVKSPKVTVVNNNGSKKTITSSIQDILDIFTNSYEMTVVEKKVAQPKTEIIEHTIYKEPAVLDFKETPILPRSLVKYAAKRNHGSEKSDKQEHIIAFTADNLHVSFDYNGTKMNNVAFPNMVFIFKIKDNRVISRHVACYKSLTLRENTELFLFPYAHVSKTNMCYGERGDLTDLVELDTWAYRWASVEMTDHYYHETRNLITAPLRELLELFSDGAAFDYDILRPLNFTFGELFSSMVDKNNVHPESLKHDEMDQILELISSPHYTKYQNGGQLQTT